MIPRTKLQKTVAGSAKKLPALSQYCKKQAIKHCVAHYAKIDSKGRYWCMDCGHTWKAVKGSDPDTVVCPHCGTKLDVNRDKKRSYVDKTYFATITTCNGFQVMRMFLISAKYKKGAPATYFFGEPFQKWIDEDGGETIYGLARHYMGWYADRWNWDSDMEIRTPNYAHSLSPYMIIGQIKVTPKLKRNGYCGSKIRELDPTTLMRQLLTDSRMETLMKAKQYGLVEHFLKQGWTLQKYWPSIKIAIRHNYKIQDVSIWIDYLNTLDRLDKDIRNPQLICPDCLKEAHDYWGKRLEIKQQKEERERQRIRQMTEEQRYQENKKKLAKDEKAYKELKSQFFDIEIKDSDMVIKPLVSVLEFLEEGHLMHHCVFANKYYERPDCLILHAIVEGVSVATIELNLESLKIIQCRGSHNTKPAQYDRIVSLIENNIGKIAAKRVA